MNNQIPISKVLLVILRELAETTIDFHDLAKAITQRYGSAWLKGGTSYVTELKRLRQHKILRQTVDQLKRTKYLAAERTGRRLLISLTNKGRAATLVEQLRQSKPRTGKMDTVVIFDIPQSHNWARKQFRQLLKQGGFVKLQQSVWISNKNCYDIVVKFIREVKMAGWINIFRAKDFLHRPKID